MFVDRLGRVPVAGTDRSVIRGLLVHRVVKLGDALMSPVFTEPRQNVTKHVGPVGGTCENWLTGYSKDPVEYFI